jgi:hypothetical protein
MKTATIANIIERDLLSERQAKPTAAKCHACGKGRGGDACGKGRGGDTSGRFCSVRCRDAYDEGIPAYDPDYIGTDPRWYSVRIGPKGLHIDCAGCGRRFDSKGLRCCSREWQKPRKAQCGSRVLLGVQTAKKCPSNGPSKRVAP